MAHLDPGLETHTHTDQRKSRFLRLFLLSTITLCGVLMIVIVASSPRAVAVMQASAEHVSTQFSPSDNSGEATPVLLLGLKDNEKRMSNTSSAQPSRSFRQQRVTSGHMPFDRMPVRRGGISSRN